MHVRRRDELESRIATLESEYEELLGKCIRCLWCGAILTGNTNAEKTINEEEVSNVDAAESMAELKVCGDLDTIWPRPASHPSNLQNKLEAQYAAKRDAHLSEVQDLKQQLDIRSNEIRTLNATIDSLKSVNDELKVGFYFIIMWLLMRDPRTCSALSPRPRRASREERTSPRAHRT